SPSSSTLRVPAGGTRRSNSPTGVAPGSGAGARVGDVAQTRAIGQRQAIAKHLVVLSRAGLVAGRRAGQEVRYALVPEPLDEVSGWMRKSARSGTHAWHACGNSRSSRINSVPHRGGSGSRGVFRHKGRLPLRRWTISRPP